MSTEDAPKPDADNDLAVLTTVPVAALGQPLIDFLAPHGIAAFVADDETGLDATRPVEVVVRARDLSQAQTLLADFWAANDGPRSEM